MGRRANQLGRLPQGRGQVDVCDDVPYGEADPAQRKLWDNLWSWLLSPIKEMEEGQGEEFTEQPCRPQPRVTKGGRASNARRRGRVVLSITEHINDTTESYPPSSNVG
jgi:hypothetical protein